MPFFKNITLYIDPATTSYIIQVVVGIVIASGTALGIFWNKVKKKVKRKNIEESHAKININHKHGGVITAEDLMNDDEKD